MKQNNWFKNLTSLHWALLISLGLHGILLSVRFVDPEAFNRIFEDTTLDVILVNTGSEETPQDAKAIAQRSLAGGGNVETGRATSPLVPSAFTQVGDAAEDTAKQVEQLLQTQQQMLSQIRRELAKLPPPDPQRDKGTPQARQEEEKRKQLLQMLAEIEKRINEENARPRKRYISPSVKEAVYAIYYDQLRRKIEERGTRNFPEINGKKLYGELTMIITVDAQGFVVDTELAQSSGNKALDGRAEAIVRAAAPYGNFTDAMRKQMDQIVVVSRFKFTREDALETTLSESAR